jgi:urea carboxylase
VGVLQVRLAGDRYVLVEYGPMELDLNLRVRIWALQAHLAAAKVRPVDGG